MLTYAGLPRGSPTSRAVGALQQPSLE